MVPVCDKRYHIYNRFRHFWAEIKKLWNYPLSFTHKNTHIIQLIAMLVIGEGEKIKSRERELQAQVKSLQQEVETRSREVQELQASVDALRAARPGGKVDATTAAQEKTYNAKNFEDSNLSQILTENDHLKEQVSLFFFLML